MKLDDAAACLEALGNPTRLHDELGWTPEIPIERTLDDLLEYWRHKTP